MQQIFKDRTVFFVVVIGLFEGSLGFLKLHQRLVLFSNVILSLISITVQIAQFCKITNHLTTPLLHVFFFLLIVCSN